MSTTIPYITLALGLALIVVLPLLLAALYKLRKDRRKHQTLQNTVARYRLSKMLAFLGIELESYVRHIPEQLIAQHVRQCAACPNIPECDSCLRDGRFIADMNFCPNYRSLMICSRKMPPVYSW